MEQIIEVLKARSLHLPDLLLANYKKLNLTDLELIVLIYLLNMDNPTYNPKEIGKYLDIKMNDVLNIINNLTEKGIISVDVVKINNVRSEVINLDLLYEKLAFIIMKKDKSKTDNGLYSVFEKELGRGLTSMEYEIINGWTDLDYSTELIICALKEAVYNGVSNFRYIDRILYEWQKKGIKTKEDVEKNRRAFKKAKNSKTELFDYDWLNDKSNN